MPRFDFTIDLAVANAALLDGTPIEVAVLVMLDVDGQVVWQSHKAYPIAEWTFDDVAREVGELQAAAVRYWPALAGACDWWMPPHSPDPEPGEIDYNRELLTTDSGDLLGLQA
jgi:hypothetical protein